MREILSLNESFPQLSQNTVIVFQEVENEANNNKTEEVNTFFC